MKNKKSNKPSGFEKVSSLVSKASGSSAAFIIALIVIFVWVITGPLFDYSDTWQLVINTGTTIITFLMVFLIQRSQNKDSTAIHLKLNEIIVAIDHANNRLVAVEEISEDELKILKTYYKHLADLTRLELSVDESHSISKAVKSNQRKKAHIDNHSK